MWCNRIKMGFKEGNASTVETTDRRSSYQVSSFSFQDRIAALGCGRGPVLKYYFLQVSAVLTVTLTCPAAHPREVGGVCLLGPSWRVSQLTGSASVIVTVKMLNGDFIFLFSDLIPFFYTAFHLTVMKKASHVLSCVFFFKGQKHWC